MVAAMDSHPRISMTNEAAWITFLRKASLLASTAAMENIDDGEGFQAAGILPHRYVAESREAFRSIMSAYVTNFYQQVVGSVGDFFGDKILSQNDLAFAVEYFPDAKYVELVRDPRDAIVSSYAFEKKQPTSWQGAPLQARCEHLDAFFTAVETLLEGRDRVLVRYEDIIADGIGTMAGLLASMGLQVTAEVEAYFSGAAKELFTTQGTSSSPGASIGRWQAELTEEQKALVHSTLTAHLQRFGYA